MRKKVVRTLADIELHQATTAGDVAAMRAAIAKGGDVNSPDEEHYITPLLWACSFANLEAVAFLVEAGAHINYADENLDTPLHNAIGRGQVETVKFLLGKGADFNVRDGCGFTALEAAVCYETSAFENRAHIIDLILERGTDINAPCALPDKRTPLMTAVEGAAQSGDTRMVIYLRQRGADMNAVNSEGDTAFAYANWGEHTAVALATLQAPIG